MTRHWPWLALPAAFVAGALTMRAWMAAPSAADEAAARVPSAQAGAASAAALLPPPGFGAFRLPPPAAASAATGTAAFRDAVEHKARALQR